MIRTIYDDEIAALVQCAKLAMPGDVPSLVGPPSYQGMMVGTDQKRGSTLVTVNDIYRFISIRKTSRLKSLVQEYNWC